MSDITISDWTGQHMGIIKVYVSRDDTVKEYHIAFENDTVINFTDYFDFERALRHLMCGYLSTDKRMM